jgi:isopentenyldiphosphate isomerase
MCEEPHISDDSEMLEVLSDSLEPIGKLSRGFVHRQGILHRTFHCWLFFRQESRVNVLVQRRSQYKALYPEVLDISVGGHLLAGEKPLDGVRELREELGIILSSDNLKELIERQDEWQYGEAITDREYCHMYGAEIGLSELSEISVNSQEVCALYHVELASLIGMFAGDKSSTPAHALWPGKGVVEGGIRKVDFLPHSEGYYLASLQVLQKHLHEDVW